MAAKNAPGRGEPVDELTARSSPCFGLLWGRTPRCSFCPLGVRHSDCKSEYDQRHEQRRIKRRLMAERIAALNQAPGETLVEVLGGEFEAILDLAPDLEARERAALKLRFESGLSFHAAGARLRLHPEQVRRTVNRALGKLRAAIKEWL